MTKKQLAPATVIIAAAGSGTRMGGVSKPLMKLDGKYAVLHSVELFMQSPFVEKICISAKKEDIPLLREIIARENYKKEVIVAEGGKTRQESVKRAFSAAFSGKSKTKFVAVHDAARPLLTAGELQRAFETAEKYGCAVCAARAKDTFKRTDKNAVLREAVERDQLWHIQTPQIFDTDMFHTALALAEKNGTEFTDESGLVHEAGFVVKLVECGHDNIKLTYPEDIFIAEAILAKRRYVEKLKTERSENI